MPGSQLVFSVDAFLLVNEHPLHLGFICLLIDDRVGCNVSLGQKVLAHTVKWLDVCPPEIATNHQNN